MDKFDKQFNRAARGVVGVGCAMAVFNALVAIAILGGIGWAAYKILQHFGII